ncbi:MAG TPA: cupin domain-containing protein [Alphaproteobacteria bacterium]
MARLTFAFAALLAILAAPALGDEGSGVDYARASTGTRLLEKGDIDIRMLLEASNLGGDEIEIGEITLPVSYGQGGGHLHGRMEIFYVLSGRLGHSLNGEAHVLEPGMIGVVRVGDSVAHAVLSDEPVKALVIWLPAGEADRLIGEFGYSEALLD